MRKRTAVILLVLVLVGAALNFPVAMWCDRSPSQQSSVATRLSLDGAEASVKPWPVGSPHGKPWPAPTQYSEGHAFGYSSTRVWGAPRDGDLTLWTTHQMVAERIGWPLPCVQRVQMWWPWGDPAWQTTAEPDPKPSVYWLGTLLNPVIFGVGIWLTLVAPFELFIAGRRRSRRRRRACERCGYPRGDGAVCTECGAALPRREYGAAAAGTGMESV